MCQLWALHIVTKRQFFTSIIVNNDAVIPAAVVVSIVVVGSAVVIHGVVVGSKTKKNYSAEFTLSMPHWPQATFRSDISFPCKEHTCKMAIWKGDIKTRPRMFLLVIFD